MSFEGYRQLLCKNGHLNTQDVYYGGNTCYVCGEKFVWRKTVDQTNGTDENDPNTYPAELEIEKDSVSETCSHCGHTKVIEERTYKIPNNP